MKNTAFINIFLYSVYCLFITLYVLGKCLYLSGLTPEPMTADDDYKLLQNGIGFTNMVERATKGSADLTRKEIKEGLFSLFYIYIKCNRILGNWLKYFENC